MKIRLNSWSLTGGAVLGLLLSAAPAAAGMLFGTDGINLYDIDPVTGQASNQRGGLAGTGGIAFHPDGTLYGLMTSQPLIPPALSTIDPVTGRSTRLSLTLLSPIGEGDLAFDPSTATLYGLQHQPAPGVHNLFTIDLSTGRSAVVGNVGSLDSDLSAMAFDAAGNFFVLDTGREELLQVNPDTAAVIRATPLSLPLGARAGMAFDSETGLLFVADGGLLGTNSLYTLDPDTGALLLRGPTGLEFGVGGLVFQPVPIPEPSTLTLVGIGALAMLGYGWRRRKRPA